jgi:hypothetical protein
MFINAASSSAAGVEDVNVAGAVAIAVVAVDIMAVGIMNVKLRTSPVRSPLQPLTQLTLSSTVDLPPHLHHQPQLPTILLNEAVVVAVASAHVAIDFHPQRLSPAPRRWGNMEFQPFTLTTDIEASMLLTPENQVYLELWPTANLIRMPILVLQDQTFGLMNLPASIVMLHPFLMRTDQ